MPRLRAKVQRRITAAEQRGDQIMYGCGGCRNPLAFLPDLDMCQSDEVGAWILACLAHEAGEAIDRTLVDHAATVTEFGQAIYASPRGWGVGEYILGGDA